jgi:hypothetical protein
MAFAETTDLGSNVRNNNNIVWKNVSVVNVLPDMYVVRTSVLLTGSKFLRKSFTTTDLQFMIPTGLKSSNILDAAYVDIDLGDFGKVWLENGGRVDSGKVYIDNYGKVRVNMTGVKGKIYGIPIRADQIGSITLEIRQKVFSPDKLFLLDFQQYDRRTLIGGERFDIRFKKEDFIRQQAAIVTSEAKVLERSQLTAYQSGSQLVIQMNDGKEYNVAVVNGVGQVVSSLSMKNQASIPVRSYSHGVYIIKLIGVKDKKVITTKVIIQ